LNCPRVIQFDADANFCKTERETGSRLRYSKAEEINKYIMIKKVKVVQDRYLTTKLFNGTTLLTKATFLVSEETNTR